MRKGTMGWLVSLCLVAPEVRGEGPTHEQGVQWTGAGFDEGGRVLRKPFWKNGWRVPHWTASAWPPKSGHTLKSERPGLTLTVQQCDPVPGPAPDAPKPVQAQMCTVAGPKDPPEGVTQYCGKQVGAPIPVIVVRGHWPSRTQFVHGEESVTAACAGPLERGGLTTKEFEQAWGQKHVGALAKCVRLWRMVASGEQLTACIHMARAAYAASRTLESFTVSGTEVDAYDIKAVQHRRGCAMASASLSSPGGADPADGDLRKCLCSMSIEAEWDENGAVCINHLRYQSLALEHRHLFKHVVGDAHCRGASKGRSHASRGFHRKAPVRTRAGYDARSLVANRSVAMKDLHSAYSQPIDDRSVWDDASCAQLCRGVTDAPQACVRWPEQHAAR